MKKIISLCFLVLSLCLWAQDDSSKSKTMGFYISPSVHVGYNLSNKSQKREDEQSAAYQQGYARYSYPNDFMYGIGFVGGYHILPFFSIGTGLKYHFVADDIHTVNWTIQPKFLIGKDDDKFTVELEYGKQLNKSNINDTEYYGLKLGYQVAFSQRLNQEFGVFVYSGNYNTRNPLFLGLSFQAIIFINKNYTGYSSN